MVINGIFIDIYQMMKSMGLISWMINNNTALDGRTIPGGQTLLMTFPIIGNSSWLIFN